MIFIKAVIFTLSYLASLASIQGADRFSNIHQWPGTQMFIYSPFIDNSSITWAACDRSESWYTKPKCSVMREVYHFNGTSDILSCDVNLVPNNEHGELYDHMKVVLFGKDRAILVSARKLKENSKGAIVQFSAVHFPSCNVVQNNLLYTSEFSSCGLSNFDLLNHLVTITAYDDKYDVIFTNKTLCNNKLCTMSIDKEGKIITKPHTLCVDDLGQASTLGSLPVSSNLVSKGYVLTQREEYFRKENQVKLILPNVIQTNHQATSIRVPVNQTSNSNDDEDDGTASTETDEELRERYRRLIPYMTYYVVNNYVRAPQQQQQQQQVKNTRYQKPTSQDDRFVPSVQYDPKELGSDSDVFLPVRYGDKDNYDDYATAVRTPRPVAVSNVQSTIPETHYHTTGRPEYTKLVPTQPDYPIYGQEFESVRFVPQLPKVSRPASAVRYSTALPLPPPRVSLGHVLKSLQLTNQLPEVLSKDNIDSSIKTLVEILNILNAGKKDNYPPISAYGKFKAIPSTKSKVITESNYEATQFSPSPNSNNELKILRAYGKPVKIPAPQVDDFVAIHPYVNQIKAAPQAISTENLIGQLKTTRPYLRPSQGFTTPIPSEDLLGIKPIPTYVKQMTTPSEDPAYVSYVKQVTIPNEDAVKAYVDHQHYTKAPVPIQYDDLVEVKRPLNVYLDAAKVDFEQTKTTRLHGGDDDAKVYVQPKETRTPMPPTDNTQKIVNYYVPIVQDIDEVKGAAYEPVSKEPAMAPSIEHTSQNNYIHHDAILEDERLTLPVSTEEPARITEPAIPPVLKYGATRGKPHVDYPAYTEIPETEFSCKQQRYKGFFGDPQTGCQVWHYCDLNGGKSSFLCPNGTIFNQVALTCDWWFNVKCESTTQLYVLNERLYKYILPVMPKFPEDFTGPEVDKYLELKFKEMEAKMMMEKKKKKAEQEEEKDKSPINTLQSIEDSKKKR